MKLELRWLYSAIYRICIKHIMECILHEKVVAPTVTVVITQALYIELNFDLYLHNSHYC